MILYCFSVAAVQTPSLINHLHFYLACTQTGAFGVMEIYMKMPAGMFKLRKEMMWNQFVFQITKNAMGSLSLQFSKTRKVVL